mmetsp:Transcript_12964/g.30958  ORF Transcript_12964/g.30958 Transcript_12964/m.30958 type:complete len:242 (-) Transcript_12964:586-1311(-)
MASLTSNALLINSSHLDGALSSCARRSSGTGEPCFFNNTVWSLRGPKSALTASMAILTSRMWVMTEYSSSLSSCASLGSRADRPALALLMKPVKASIRSMQKPCRKATYLPAHRPASWLSCTLTGCALIRSQCRSTGVFSLEMLWRIWTKLVIFSSKADRGGTLGPRSMPIMSMTCVNVTPEPLSSTQVSTKSFGSSHRNSSKASSMSSVQRKEYCRNLCRYSAHLSSVSSSRRERLDSSS